MLRVVQQWPALSPATPIYARAIVRRLNAESLREGRAAWLHIDRRRGWLVVVVVVLRGVENYEMGRLHHAREGNSPCLPARDHV